MILECCEKQMAFICLPGCLKGCPKAIVTYESSRICKCAYTDKPHHEFLSIVFVRHGYFSTHAPCRGDITSSFNEGSGMGGCIWERGFSGVI